MMLEVKPHKKTWLIVVLALFATAGAAIGAVYFLHAVNQPVAVQESTETPKPEPVVADSIESTVGFFGNVYWGRYINDWSRASELGVAYPFSRLKEFDRKSYDAWIAGLECPTVAGVNLTSAQEEATLSFNCSPDYLPEAAKWFTAFTLANNHTDNQGIEGFDETKNQLDRNKIQYFGHYDPRALNDLCDVIRLPARLTMTDGSVKKVGLPIALCGYHGVFRIPTDESLAVMQKYSEIMPVVAMPHSGAEYQPAPDALKTTLYREMIDNGADMVIGDHPHWIQTTESYEGKLIVYSMGNFMFDQQFNAEVTRSAGIRLEISSDDAPAKSLTAWTELADSCNTYQDSCLADAKEAGLTKLPLKYKFSVVPTNNQNRLAHPANAAQSAEILRRLRWSETIQNLRSPQEGV